MDRSNFEQFFEGTLRELLQALEEARFKLLFQGFKCIVVAIVAGLVTMYVVMQFFEGARDVMIMFLIPGIGAGSIAGWIARLKWFDPGWEAYVARFKGEIIAEILRFISPTLQYQSGAGFPVGAYQESGIFPRRTDRYKGDDYVSGTVGATALRFSEVHAEYKTEYRVKGRRHEKWHTIFRGLFFQADFNKHFSARTYVLTDVAEKWLGTLIGQALQGSHQSAERVKLEDPVFEKEFVVHGTDQIEARYILTPALMTRLVEFKKKAGRAVQFSFIGSHVYVAIPYSEELFEPRLYRSGVSIERIQGYYDALAITVSIVEDLSLNTRIWTKA